MDLRARCICCPEGEHIALRAAGRALMTPVDVQIKSSGAVASAFALALGPLGLRVVLSPARHNPKDPDIRTYALNAASRTYFVEVDRASPALAGHRSSIDIATSPNPDTDVDNDDNGVTISVGAVRSGAVTLTVNGEPTTDGDADTNSNLSVDFGFVPELSLGNLVWSDVNDNGAVDSGENGIGGVTVRLIAANGTTVLATTVTNGSGLYLFAGLLPGTYFVEVVPPANSTSSTDIGSSGNPDNDVDNDDNGVTIGGGVVRSGPVTLSINGEPTGDGTATPTAT